MSMNERRWLTTTMTGARVRPFGSTVARRTSGGRSCSVPVCPLFGLMKVSAARSCVTASIRTRDVFTRKPTFCVPPARRWNQHRLIAGVGVARGDGVGVDLIGQPLERRQIENLDVADDVRRPHQLADRQRRLSLPAHRCPRSSRC